MCRTAVSGLGEGRTCRAGGVHRTTMGARRRASEALRKKQNTQTEGRVAVLPHGARPAASVSLFALAACTAEAPAPDRAAERTDMQAPPAQTPAADLWLTGVDLPAYLDCAREQSDSTRDGRRRAPRSRRPRTRRTTRRSTARRRPTARRRKSPSGCPRRSGLGTRRPSRTN